MNDALLPESAWDLFERAPCGYLVTRLDGTIVRVNRTFEEWTGRRREDLLSGRRFQDLLSVGGRIYHETHYAPLLHVRGEVRAVSLDIVREDGSRLPALVNSVVRGIPGAPRLVRTAVFDATDRRGYEQELLNIRNREQEVARTLQHSMLSGTMPQDDALELEVAYQPAVASMEIGGDWYDAFWIDEGRSVGLVVGDVVGRGIHAAAAMGQLRSALRALAGTGLSPGALLAALDGFSIRHGVGEMATVAYLQADLTDGEVRFACAGHPPPVLIEPGRKPCLAWDGRSVPLNAHLEARPETRAESSLRLTPGSIVLLFSDGLVERPGEPLDSGFERLLAEIQDVGTQPLPVMAESVMRAMVGARGRGDDVCLLAARLTPKR